MATFKRKASLAAAALAIVIASGTGASPALATDYPLTFTFYDTTTLTVVYGQSWNFRYHQYPVPQVTPCNPKVISTGTPAGFKARSTTDPVDIESWIIYPTGPALGVGVYTFSAAATPGNVGDTCDVEPHAPAQLTVTPAPIGIDLGVSTASSDPTEIHVLADLTGEIVEQFASEGYELDQAPSGTWELKLQDSAGRTVAEQQAFVAPRSTSFSVDFAWSDAKPDTVYSADVTFVPTGNGAANYTVAPAARFEFTTAKAARIATPTATPTPTDPALIPASANSATPDAPVWLVALLSLLVVGLSAALIVWSVRHFKRKSAQVASVSEADVIL